MGFSNGGAFAVLLALHGLVDACGTVSLHGFPAGAMHPRAEASRPLLLVAGRGAEWEPRQLEATTAQLRPLGWPFETKTHDEAHAVSDADLDDAVAFARDAVARCKGSGD